MTKFKAIILVVLLCGGCATIGDEDAIIRAEQYPSIPPTQPIVLSRTIGKDRVTIRSEAEFAGAISSLMFRGQEYINSADHGRLMQGAIAYNGRFECLNPTQAGSSRDRLNFNNRSSSRRLRTFVTAEGDLYISTRMAYWRRPGMSCDTPSFGPGFRPGFGRSPVDNQKRLSDDTYSISHRFALNGRPNVVGAHIEFNIASVYRSAVVEALTIYTPPIFNTFHSLNSKTGAVTLEPTLTAQETASPAILSTADGTHAIAFLSLQAGAAYARFRFAETTKISLVYRETGSITGNKTYSAAWVIGTRDEVIRELQTILANQKDFGFPS